MCIRDRVKVHAAYRAAVEHRGAPTVILAKTIKGYGLGEGGEGRNVTHQQKKLNEEELRQFRDRFEIPIPDAQLAETPFYRPPDDAIEMEYLRERDRAGADWAERLGLDPGSRPEGEGDDRLGRGDERTGERQRRGAQGARVAAPRGARSAGSPRGRANGDRPWTPGRAAPPGESGGGETGRGPRTQWDRCACGSR